MGIITKKNMVAHLEELTRRAEPLVITRLLPRPGGGWLCALASPVSFVRPFLLLTRGCVHTLPWEAAGPPPGHQSLSLALGL